APGPSRPGLVWPAPSPASKFHTQHRAETPGPSPGSAGPRPASGPQAPHGGIDASRLQSAVPRPDYKDRQAPGPASLLPDSAARPASERPGTTVCSPQGHGTVLQAP